MRAVGKFIRKRKVIQDEIELCKCGKHNWHKYLHGCIEDFVESTCCEKMEHPQLSYGAGSSARIPKLVKWNCVKNVCTDCGIENNLEISACNILGECNIEIDVLEWVHAERQGINKQTGKANTQLELGQSKLPVKEVIKKLIAQLTVVREHQAQYEWRNLMRKVDHTMGDSSLHRVICTDFGATLDLMAVEKDNSLVNNHAVICIFLCHMIGAK